MAYPLKPISVTTSTLTLKEEQHAGAILLANRAAGIVFTLPAASGSGAKYMVLCQTTITSNSLTIQVANASDTMVGFVETATTTGATTNGFAEGVGGTDDTIAMNGTTTGGIAGSYVECTDVAANLWLVHGELVGSGTLATSVSAAVS